MANTPKLGMYLPVSASDVADVQIDLNNQIQKIDDVFDCIVATSGTRPISPFAGQLIYETDTKLLQEYSGATWKPILSPTWPFGKIDYQTGLSTPDVTANQEKLIAKSSWNQVNGRKYRAGYNACLNTHGVNNQFGDNQFRIRSSTRVNDIATSDPLVYWNWADYSNGNTGATTNHQGFFEFTASSSGPITLGFFLEHGSSNQSIYVTGADYSCWYVEDVGSN